jgi:transcriptional regulator with XRE-family HTH domain
MERKLRTLTISEKGKLLDVLDRGVKQADAAAEFGISKATVSRIWKLKDSIRQDLASSHASVLEDRKRKRVGKVPDIEEALLEWLQDQVQRGGRISGELL